MFESQSPYMAEMSELFDRMRPLGDAACNFDKADLLRLSRYTAWPESAPIEAGPRRVFVDAMGPVTVEITRLEALPRTLNGDRAISALQACIWELSRQAETAIRDERLTHEVA